MKQSEPSMVTSLPKPPTSAVAIIEQPSSEHPAYWPLFAHYQASGRSATRALALLAHEWDEEMFGPLPSERTARHWARVDGWDAMIQAAIETSVVEYRAYVEMQLLTSALEGIHALNRVAHGEFSDSRLANAMVRAAVVALNAAGYGPPSRRRKATKAA
jgi:hypothetical protein